MAVSYASRDHLLKKKTKKKPYVGLCFHCMFGLFSEQDYAFSVLSAFQMKVTNGVLSVLWL